MLEITKRLLPTPSQRRSGIKNSGITFLVSHDTGNAGSTANQNVIYYSNFPNTEQASAHYFVDDKDVIQVIPDDEKAWHVRHNVPKDNELYGVNANDYALGIELCFDPQGISVDNIKAYYNYVDLHAELCTKYKINPRTNIVGHYLLDPTRRTDPLNAFKYINKTWDLFINDICEAMNLYGGWSYLFTGDISYGQTNDDVQALQIALQHLDLFHLTPTGYYGEETRKSVKLFQQKFSIASWFELMMVNGKKVGPKTKEKLNQLFYKKYV